MLKIIEYFLLAVFIAGLLLIGRWTGQLAYTWMPLEATAEARRVDELFSFLVSIGTFVFLGLVGMILYSALFYRARPGDYSEGHPARGSARLEILWTIAPVLLVAWIALQNINIYNRLDILGLRQIVRFPLEIEPAVAESAVTTPKPAAETIGVIAKQWRWLFRYPNGAESGELHLPIDESTKLALRAEDVIHGFYVAEFRLRQDAIPGRDIALVLTPTRAGKYLLQDAQFSGDDFSRMRANVYVESREEYDRWLESVARQPPAEKETTITRSPEPLLKTRWSVTSRSIEESDS
ncbi:cytochrome c oxidase subunit II [Pannus brasiliensis CCIBt3594]|uniref:Cytochrome c oxidase subunit 2 n=1 Tax=Pannus brasiliensis CCIBt3594 TaxID=1427578 RepID=A0AAW9R0L9_9CHRO